MLRVDGGHLPAILLNVAQPNTLHLWSCLRLYNRNNPHSTSHDRPWLYRRAGLSALKEAPITRTLPRFSARSTLLNAIAHVAGIMCFGRRAHRATPSEHGARLCYRATIAFPGPYRRYETRMGCSHRNALPTALASIVGHMRACRRLAVAFGKVARSLVNVSTLHRRAPHRCLLYRRPSPLNTRHNLHNRPANVHAERDGRRWRA